MEREQLISILDGLKKLGSTASKIDRAQEKGRTGLKVLKTVLIIIGVVVLIAAIAYALYRFFQPDYYEGYDDDVYDDDYEEEEAAEAEDEDTEENSKAE